MDELFVNTRIQINRSSTEIFQAITDPEKMSHYFIEWGSGRMEEGEIIKWKFPEFDDEFNVRVGEVREPGYISFFWEMGKDEMKIEIELKNVTETTTVVSVTETGKILDEEGLAWLKGNTEGWANFLACLKAYMEYGVNLRLGAFDFMRKENLK